MTQTNEQLLQVVRESLEIASVSDERNEVHYTEALSALAELEARLRWIPVSERLPDPLQEEVDVWCEASGRWPDAIYQGDDKWNYIDHWAVTADGILMWIPEKVLYWRYKPDDPPHPGGHE